ncbi:MAG: SpoIID/LytB domain-containing protein [Bacteroidales bacterium]
MYLKIRLLVIILAFPFKSLLSQKIEIGILSEKQPKKFLIEATSGKYKIKSGNKTIYRLKKERSVIVNIYKSNINLSNARRDFGLFNEISVYSKNYSYEISHFKENSRKNCELNLQLIEPKSDSRKYAGNINIKILENGLRIINQVGFQDYIAGVVEAESGTNAEPEYYKNQAVICRTYALKNIDKHKNEQFNLCDGVHCQAYKGKSTGNKSIQKSVDQTDNLVIVDKKGELISALFSANCGGQTCNSEDVWTSKVDYLRSVKDDYCIDQRQATWKKTIARNDFVSFLKSKNLNVPDTISIDSLAFDQSLRKVNYVINNQEIRLTSIRSGFNLRSAFFNIIPNGDSLYFKGRGYGHGVGMCQEGAMNMAKSGFKFDQIIKFYYTGVDIIPLKKAGIKFPLESGKK